MVSIEHPFIITGREENWLLLREKLFDFFPKGNCSISADPYRILKFAWKKNKE